jgi:hypothetical protein
MIRSLAAAMIAVTLAASASLAQEQGEEGEPSGPMGDMPMTEQRDEASGEASPKMEHMADAMASMARACETMMEREMAAYPWKMAALGGLGILGSLALLLFVILEIQWIRFFSLRIKKAKRELHESR